MATFLDKPLQLTLKVCHWPKMYKLNCIWLANSVDCYSLTSFLWTERARHSAVAHGNLVFLVSVTKHTSLSSRCSVFRDTLKTKTVKKKPTSLAARRAKIAHIFIQELPEQKHSKLFVFLQPGVSQVLKLSRCPTHCFVSSAAIVVVVMRISGIMRRGCVGIAGGWLWRGGWMKSNGSKGWMPRLPTANGLKWIQLVWCLCARNFCLSQYSCGGSFRLKTLFSAATHPARINSDAPSLIHSPMSPLSHIFTWMLMNLFIKSLFFLLSPLIVGEKKRGNLSWKISVHLISVHMWQIDKTVRKGRDKE